ncbi:MAG: hypothetical protein WCG02_00700 [Candidatus Taylorbacteria bacterium]
MSTRRIRHQSESFMRRRKSRAILLVTLMVVCLASWTFSFVRFVSLDALNIGEVNISGVDASLVPGLQSAALESLRGDILGVIPKSNILFYSKTTVMNTLRAMSPEIGSMTVSRHGGKAIDIHVTEKTSVAIVCTEYPDFASTTAGFGNDDGNCYYADSSGYLFKHAPTISGIPLHRYYAPLLIDSGSSTVQLVGKYATSKAEFAGLERFYSDVLKSGIIAQAILVKDAGEYELYVLDPSGDNVVVVYINNSRSFDDQFANLASFWSNMMSKADTKSQISTLDYIDVRYGANVFYK